MPVPGSVTDGGVTDGVVTDGVVTDGVVTDDGVTDGGVTGSGGSQSGELGDQLSQGGCYSDITNVAVLTIHLPSRSGFTVTCVDACPRPASFLALTCNRR